MLKASRKSRRVAVAGAVGIASLTVAGLGLTASGAAAEKIRTVAETQVAAMAQATAPTPPVAPVPPVAKPDGWTERTAPGAERKRKVVIVRNGKTETYEGAAADAYIAANPGIARPGGREVSRHRIVIRDKNGERQVYEGAEADAYLKANPQMRAPVPPVPPVPGGLARPVPAVPNVSNVVVVTSPDGKSVSRHVVRTGPGGFAYANGSGALVSSGKCAGDNDREFIRNETKDGKTRMVICEDRIERFAEGQARMAESQAKLAAIQVRLASDQARRSKRTALMSLNASRSSITRARGLSDAQRAQALAGIDQARADLEREISEGKDD